MDYFKKYDKNPFSDLRWNIPERKQGTVAIMGGNAQNFRTPIRIAEWMTTSYPIESVRVVLPNALENKLPPLPNLTFLSSTESGSFSKADEIASALEAADFSLIIGDLSRNAVTAKAVGEVCKKISRPLVITRDTVDLLTSEINETVLMNNNLISVASMAQLQKLFRAVYYPKMLTMTQPLPQIVEALHKFTLSYPVKIATLFNNQILLAENGEVAAVPLEKTGYSPLTIWGGEFASKILIYNLFNPSAFMRSAICASFLE